MESASRCHLVKIDRIQYKALRQSCGTMRSTPCLPLLAECSEHPLNIRREFLAKKFILKIKVANSEFIIDPIYNIALADLTNRFWRIKNSPPLAAAFRDLSHMENIGTFRILQVENGPSSIRFQPIWKILVPSEFYR
ncbi:hypothetical protein QE152_g22042 [Popillia japonica]|uniref:Uncharacterized protein n=1 Tax=Popillia japonica TaxID=7064 RepID=A0AAW1KLC9_POPJA